MLSIKRSFQLLQTKEPTKKNKKILKFKWFLFLEMLSKAKRHYNFTDLLISYMIYNMQNIILQNLLQHLFNRFYPFSIFF